MRNGLKRAITTVLALSGLVLVPLSIVAKEGKQIQTTYSQITPQGEERLQREVLHQLRLLPYYTVFDDLGFRVQGYTVELFGQVVNPVLRSDAAGVVKHIEGVERIVNDIEVLPLSNFDNQIRLGEYRAIYWHPGLDRYALQAVPPIHIIVKNGHVTLTGVVANEMDKNLAGIRANGVSGVFSLTNNLRVEK